MINTSDHLTVRRVAIRTHASQISPFESLPEDVERAFLAVDRLQRVVPPWEGGPVESALFSR